VEQATPMTAEPNIGLPDQEILDGCDIATYADARALSTDEVWQRIRRGELIGRTQEGLLYVYEREGSMIAAQRQFGASAIDEAPLADEIEIVDAAVEPEEIPHSLPPLPVSAGIDTDKTYLAFSGEKSASPEVALLLDHLSLAKEEHREILRMTQESIQRITQMTDSLMAVKDELLAEKDQRLRERDEELSKREQEISRLKSKLEKKNHSVKKLRQDIEDFEMLTKSLGAEQ